ncbi:MAG: hypothetical protein IK054_07335 [Lachnospiraceae bacterium]|nr:hypothetical protein [Lachnospiraceae bacterium]
MKRGFKRGMVLVMAASMLMQACTGGATSQASSQSAAKVSDLNLVDPDGKATTIHGFTKEGLPVPYVDLVEYMHTVYDPKNVFSLSSQGSGAYKISNAKGEMTVDTAKDTIHSDKIEQFLYNDERLDPTNTNYYVYEHIIATEYRESPKALDIDFSKYGIDIIEEGGRVYFPLTTAADLTGVTYINTVYSDNKIYQNYSINKPDVKWQANYNKETRDPGEIAYTYGELCFMMDYVYGDAPHCALAKSISEKGLDATLESYSDETRLVKELLKSDKMVDYIFGISILSAMLYDGGHTDLFTDIMTDLEGVAAFDEYSRIVHEEKEDKRAALFTKYYSDNVHKMDAKFQIKELNGEYDKYKAVFDDQQDVDVRYSYFEYNNTGIYVFTTFNDDAVKYFKKALDLAKEHGMKNFILDDSNNGGGSTESCMYILNAITKDKRDEFYYAGTMTGNTVYEKLDYDMDQDGKFEGDAEDFDYNFNYAVMCSQGSYSSGNILPCLSKEAGIPIIGETSAGGTCNLVYFKMDLGVQYSLSAFRTFNYKKGGDLEAGATPDYDILKKNPDGTKDYSDFRNFKLLDEIVNKHYATNQ